MTNLPVAEPDRGISLGEFVVEFPAPEGVDINSLPVAEPEQSIWLGEFISEPDVPAPTNGKLRTFVVLRNNGPALTVCGHGLKQQAGSAHTPSSYEIVLNDRGREVVVAVFRADAIEGIYEGEAPAPNVA